MGQNQQFKKHLAGRDGIVYLGGIKKSSRDTFDGKASVVMPNNATLLTRNQVMRLANLIDRSLDMELLYKVAAEAGVLKPKLQSAESQLKTCRVAVADDQAFQFTIQNNWDRLKEKGAELEKFSPLIDESLPENCSALYLPGVYLGLYLSELAANKEMMASIREFAARGGVIYAEGSSLAYMCRSLIGYEGAVAELLGLVPARATLDGEERIPESPAYCDLAVLEPNILSRYTGDLRGLKISAWQVERLGAEVAFNSIDHGAGSVPEAKQNSDIEQRTPEGIVVAPNILATGINLHWGSGYKVAESFIELSSILKERNAAVH